MIWKIIIVWSILTYIGVGFMYCAGEVNEKYDNGGE